MGKGKHGDSFSQKAAPGASAQHLGGGCALRVTFGCEGIYWG